MKTRNGDLRSPADRLLSGGRSRRSTTAAAGSNFDHGGNEERIPEDVGPRETYVHRVLSVGVETGGRGGRGREREREGRSAGGTDDRARRRIKETEGERERADPGSGGRPRDRVGEMARRGRGGERQRGRRTKQVEGKDELSRERESNVEKEEVGLWTRDEESECGEKEREGE